MAYEVILFSSNQKLTTKTEIDESQFTPADFNEILENYFLKLSFDKVLTIEANENFRRIVGKDFDFEYFHTEELQGNLLLSLYGKNAILESVELAKKNNLQIFDLSSGESIDLENPEINGYSEFENYRAQILEGEKLTQKNLVKEKSTLIFLAISMIVFIPYFFVFEENKNKYLPTILFVSYFLIALYFYNLVVERKKKPKEF